MRRIRNGIVPRPLNCLRLVYRLGLSQGRVTRLGSLLAFALSLPYFASPNPPFVPRASLPQIERNLAERNPQLQLQGLGDLLYLEGGVTQDLVTLLPRVLELCRSGNNSVASAALSVMRCFAGLPETRRTHGRAMLLAIRAALDSESADVRFRAIYSTTTELIEAHTDLALPMLISSVGDEDEQVRVWGVIAMGKMSSPNARVVNALRKSLADPAMQVRPRCALSRHSVNTGELHE